MVEMIASPSAGPDGTLRAKMDSNLSSPTSLTGMMIQHHQMKNVAADDSCLSYMRNPDGSRKAMLLPSRSKSATTPRGLQEVLEQASEHLKTCGFDFAEEPLTPKLTRDMLERSKSAGDEELPKTPKLARDLLKFSPGKKKSGGPIASPTVNNASARNRRLCALRSKDPRSLGGGSNHSSRSLGSNSSRRSSKSAPAAPSTSTSKCHSKSKSTRSSSDRALRMPQRKKSFDADTDVLQTPQRPSSKRRIRRRSSSSSGNSEEDQQVRKEIAATLKIEGVDENEKDMDMSDADEEKHSHTSSRSTSSKRPKSNEKKVDRKLKLPSRKPSGIDDDIPRCITTFVTEERDQGGLEQGWTCVECDFARNKCKYIFCGKCGNPKKTKEEVAQ